jgi:hypothetical protein
MNLEQRIQSFEILSVFLQDFLNNENNPRNILNDKLEQKINESFLYNGWFTKANVKKSISGIATLLNAKYLNQLKEINKEVKTPKTIAVIMAGNIPAVGFHDLACVLLSGNKVLIKLSSDDKIIIPFLLEVLIDIEPSFKDYILFSQNKLSGFDAVIATGSNNSATYFHYYFGKYPHIIRKNRNSLAVLNGAESIDDLAKLGNDVFDYYGLGCRNVSKLFVPKNYSFNLFFESIYRFGNVIENKKYANNYEYNRAIYLMTQEKFLDNNFLIIKEENKIMSSPIGVLFFEEYNDLNDLENQLLSLKDQIQCVASNLAFKQLTSVNFGETQSPGFFDYPDGVDIMKFLRELN